MSILLVSRYAEQLDGRCFLSLLFCPEVGEEPASGRVSVSLHSILGGGMGSAALFRGDMQ